jgi:hypothetical protein
MGEFWDLLTGATAKQVSAELLREKFPAVKGLPPETLAEAEEIEPADHPQVEKLREIGSE